MANLNKVMLIGRLTRDPESIEVRGAVQGAKFGFAVNNRKLNVQTNQWEDIPVFLDVEIWNRGENRQGECAQQTLRKGQQVFIEGHLKMDTWDDKNGGGKRSKLTIVVETFQYLEPRSEGAGEGMPPRESCSGGSPRPAAPGRGSGYNGNYDESDMGSGSGCSGPGAGNEEDIPF